MKEMTRSDLLEVIRNLKDALEFDSENCDFGPAYGIGMERRKEALRKARSALRQEKRIKQTDEFRRESGQRLEKVKDETFRLLDSFSRGSPKELESRWHLVYSNVGWAFVCVRHLSEI